jgi:hypothetical protein
MNVCPADYRIRSGNCATRGWRNPRICKSKLNEDSKMRKQTLGLVFGIAVLISRAGAQQATSTESSRLSASSRGQVSSAMGRLPLTFEANQGQTGAQAKFIAHGKGYLGIPDRWRDRPFSAACKDRAGRTCGQGRFDSRTKSVDKNGPAIQPAGGKSESGDCWRRRRARPSELLHRERPQALAHECAEACQSPVQERLSFEV